MVELREEAKRFVSSAEEMRLFFTTTKCAREAVMSGIGGGAACGVLRYMLSGNVLSGCNYAVGVFGVISIGSWEYCRYFFEKRMAANQLLIKSLKERDQRLAETKGQLTNQETASTEANQNVAGQTANPMPETQATSQDNVRQSANHKEDDQSYIKKI